MLPCLFLHNRNNDLAAGVFFFEMPKCFGGLAQRVNFIDNGDNLSRRKQVANDRQILGIHFCRPHALDPLAAQQHDME